jgi:hypothetical protein
MVLREPEVQPPSEEVLAQGPGFCVAAPTGEGRPQNETAKWQHALGVACILTLRGRVLRPDYLAKPRAVGVKRARLDRGIRQNSLRYYSYMPSAVFDYGCLARYLRR